jgi:hypothetical protein
MVDRLRALLDHPLDPSAARAILVLASAILVVVAGLFVLAASESDSPVSGRKQAPSVAGSQSGPAISVEPGAVPEMHPSARQDPQDVPGSAAARRASRALRSHRALQYVPYRDDELAITLIGARGSRAVLRVTADTTRDARRGWHRFLRRYRDAGRAYVPIFKAATESTAARGGA